MAEASHDRQKQINDVKLSHQDIMSKLRINKKKEIANVETEKFESIMSTLGQDTLKDIARSGMQSQQELLKGLGLKGYLLTDGKTPVNLFNAAEGMMARK